MNRERWALKGAVAASVAACLAAATIRAQEQEDAGPRDAREAVKKAGPLSIWTVTQEFTGSFQDVKTFINTFNGEFAKQGLDVSLTGFDTRSILVLEEDPGDQPRFRISVGLTVPARLPARPPLRVRRFFEPAAARYKNVGPYAKLPRVHREIVKSKRAMVPEQGGLSDAAAGRRAGFPVILVLLNDPTLVKPEEIRTEMIVPLPGPLAEQAGPEEAAAIAKAAKRPTRLDYNLVYESFQGSPAQIGDFLSRFMSNFESQKLGSQLSGPEARPLAVIHANPELNRSVRIDIGFPVKQGARVAPPLAMRRLALTGAVEYNFRGRFEGIGRVHRELVKGMPKAAVAKGEPGFPTILVLESDPRLSNSPDEVRTGVIVPSSMQD